MYKMIVSNFDKTLIDDDDAIPISTMICIDTLRKSNKKLTILTNREITYVKYYTKDINFIDYIIALNGSYIYDSLNDRVLYKNPLDKESVEKVINEYTKKIPITIYTEENKYKIKDQIDEIIKNKDIYKIDLCLKTNKECDKIIEELNNKQLNINVNKHKIKIRKYKVEIINKSSSKYKALLKILKKENIDKEEVITIGQNYSDIELIEKTGLGIAVKNAVKEVIKKSKYLTNSNNKKGVEKILKKIINKKENYEKSSR